LLFLSNPVSNCSEISLIVGLSMAISPCSSKIIHIFSTAMSPLIQRISASSEML
jgi:hypothetical protein